MAALIAYMACFWRANRFVYCKTLFTDSGQSIYLALSHFISKTAALRTAAQSITSKNLYKMLAKGFLFVSFHLKNFPSAIGLYVNWSSISLCSDWGIYCSRSIRHLTIESVTGLLFCLDYLKIACHGGENSMKGHFNWYVWKFEFTFLIPLKCICCLTHY